MPALTVKIRTVSPLFLTGADKNKPELRAASVRGQLRYWFRAIEGAKTNDLNEVWKAEEAVFGSANVGSQVGIRVYSRSGIETESYAQLPHRSEKKSFANAVKLRQVFELQMVPKVGHPLPDTAVDTLLVWLLLGGIGKRSRRMMGALDSTLLGKQRPSNPEALAKLIPLVLQDVVGSPPNLAVPAFPTLHPLHSRIVVGTTGFASAEEANIGLFSILRSNEFRPDERTFGHAMQGRRASPLIAQVREIKEQYYPVLTVMRSRDIKDREWNVLNTFLTRCEDVFSGTTVWGRR